MDTSIFREYDIRGIVPSQIDETTAFTIGQSFASYIKDKKVIIGRDNRLSSPVIHDNLVKGLLSCGADIIDLGLCTTPMYYALKKYLNYENGIMITASHNPKEYNGFKISFSKKGNAFGKAIYDFRDFTLNEKFTLGQGCIHDFSNTKNVYLDLIKKSIDLGPRKLKVVFDPGNGTGSVILKDVLDLFNIDYVIINGESDGNFPAHHPDPCEPKNMIELGNKVKELGYDLGIGIDGDADRVGVVDENGNLIPVDKLLILMYEYLNPNLKVRKAIMDVKCSKAVVDEMNKINLPITVYRTGNSYMNNKINEDHLDFGGEFSGHLWFTDKWPGFDDGIYSGLRFMEMMSNTYYNISDFTKKLPVYYNTPEIKVPIAEEKKDVVIGKIKEYLDQKQIKYNDIDGIRVDYDDGFALVRKSNTGPNLTIRFEKKTKEELQKVQNEFETLINKYINE